MRSLLLSAFFVGCLATSQAFAADRVVVPYTQDDLASEASIATLHQKITAAALKVCREEFSLLHIQQYVLRKECEQASVQEAVAEIPALAAYVEQLNGDKKMIVLSETLASR